MPLLVCEPTGRLWLARQKDVKSFHTVIAHGPKKWLAVAAAKCSERRGDGVFVPGMGTVVTPKERGMIDLQSVLIPTRPTKRRNGLAAAFGLIFAPVFLWLLLSVLLRALGGLS